MLLDHENRLNLTVQDIACKRIAVLGASGRGKTNTVARLVEQLLPSMPMTIIDPHEDYYGLREKFPTILIAGKGLHTDIDLSVDHAAQLAEYSFNNRLPVILDMLLMDEDEREEMAFAYCMAVWQCAIKASVRLPYGVVLDEAHNFIPEGGKRTPATKEMTRFANEGRKFGFTIVLSTQRSAAISKAVLGNCEMHFLHGVNIINDVKAYHSVLPIDSLREVKKLAYSLDVGEVLFRQGLRMERVHIFKRETFHAGDTPTLDNAPVPIMQQIDAEMLERLKAALNPPKETRTDAAVASTPTVEAELQVAHENAERWHLLAEERAGAMQSQAREIERLTSQLQMMVQQSDTPRENVPMFNAAMLETDSTIVWEKTTTTERAIEHLSTRQTQLQIKQQERERDQVVTRLRGLERAHRRIVKELMSKDDQKVTAIELAKRLDYAEKTVREAGNELHRMGLIRRVSAGIFAGAFGRYAVEQFPMLDASDVFERMLRSVAS